MKKVGIIVLVLLVAMFFLGCTQTEPEQNSNDTTTNNSTTITPENTNNNASVTPTGVEHNIRIAAGHFNPEELTINAGDTVVFRNEDSVIHAIVSNSFNSENLSKSVMFKHTFLTPGTYNYSCKFHEIEKGTIIVK